MVRSCGIASSSTPGRLSLLTILAETATMRLDATHDVNWHDLDPIGGWTAARPVLALWANSWPPVSRRRFGAVPAFTARRRDHHRRAKRAAYLRRNAVTFSDCSTAMPARRGFATSAGSSCSPGSATSSAFCRLAPGLPEIQPLKE